MPDSIGDHVRVADTSVTRAAGYAGRSGTVYGFTTPSITGVAVIGDTGEDIVISVEFDGSEEAWFAPGCLTLIDHGARSTMSIGDKHFVRTADGEWLPAPPE